jgi:hypothetical protein
MEHQSGTEDTVIKMGIPLTFICQQTSLGHEISALVFSNQFNPLGAGG